MAVGGVVVVTTGWTFELSGRGDIRIAISSFLDVFKPGSYRPVGPQAGHVSGSIHSLC